ncbi:MAG: alpha/beta hydrolase [Pseudomonadota bacterium]
MNEHAPIKTTVEEEAIDLTCADGVRIAGTLFFPIKTGKSKGPKVLISGAAAVPHTYYHPFARHLIDEGSAAVFTYDYRGIGVSAGDRRDWKTFRMADWGRQDFVVAADYLNGRNPNTPMVGIGHSFGGQALGLSDRWLHFSRYLAIASMSGYWRGTDEPIGVYLKTQFLGAPLAVLLGRVPGWLGIGETMPGPVFRDWARWIKSPDYFFSDPALPETRHYGEVALPLRVVQVTDDAWGTKRAIHSLFDRYTGADTEHVAISPDEASGSIGHLGFFRRRHAENHWPKVSEWLLTDRAF